MKRELASVAYDAFEVTATADDRRFYSRNSSDLKDGGPGNGGPFYQRRGSLQLWQFLVSLLDCPSNSSFISWTGKGLEFKLIEPEEVRSFQGLWMFEFAVYTL